MSLKAESTLLRVCQREGLSYHVCSLRSDNIRLLRVSLELARARSGREVLPRAVQDRPTVAAWAIEIGKGGLVSTFQFPVLHRHRFTRIGGYTSSPAGMAQSV